MGELEALIDPGLRVGRNLGLIQFPPGKHNLPITPINNVTINIDVVKIVVKTNLLQLAVRELETEPAKHGLSISYTIDNQTASAHEFLFGSSSFASAVVQKSNEDFNRSTSLSLGSVSLI